MFRARLVTCCAAAAARQAASRAPRPLAASALAAVRPRFETGAGSGAHSLTSLFTDASTAPRQAELQDPHAILGVAPAASALDIELAYRRLVLRCLPEYEFEDNAAEAAVETLRRVSSAYASLVEPFELKCASFGKVGVALET
mmetsp:Transcript_102712/g.260930  ORF Transcript_102712/g.260930 Transcript_102712/m.260930 type:complete len:143 (-) Transcript_102712:185-613(-)